MHPIIFSEETIPDEEINISAQFFLMMPMQFKFPRRHDIEPLAPSELDIVQKVHDNVALLNKQSSAFRFRESLKSTQASPHLFRQPSLFGDSIVQQSSYNDISPQLPAFFSDTFIKSQKAIRTQKGNCSLRGTYLQQNNNIEVPYVQFRSQSRLPEPKETQGQLVWYNNGTVRWAIRVQQHLPRGILKKNNSCTQGSRSHGTIKSLRSYSEKRVRFVNPKKHKKHS